MSSATSLADLDGGGKVALHVRGHRLVFTVRRVGPWAVVEHRQRRAAVSSLPTSGGRLGLDGVLPNLLLPSVFAPDSMRL